MKKRINRRTRVLLYTLLLAAVVLSTVALVTLHGSIQNNRSQYEAMRIQAAMLESRNKHLTFCIENVGTVEGIERIAMEELGLVYPGSVIFTPDD